MVIYEARCYIPVTTGFYYYGGRGIKFVKNGEMIFQDLENGLSLMIWTRNDNR